MIVDNSEQDCRKILERFLAKTWVYQWLKINFSTLTNYDICGLWVRYNLNGSATSLINNVLEKEKITLKDLQSIIGTLNFACAVVVPGRAFLHRLIDLTIGISKPIYKIRITKSVKEDLIIWRDFLSNFNGKSLFLSDRSLTSESLNLFTDASGTLGYGVFLGIIVFLVNGIHSGEIQI